jgi:pyruvate/2-oxoglutarate dehydrogenase complex dihydrolipoamide acyltransferase (E2) component
MKRNDAEKVRDLDALHRIIPYLMKRRTDSVVYYTIQVDIENAMRYLREKNEGKHKRYYSYFVLILAALLRTIALRPHLNRFIANNTFYQRKDISFTFIVKKELSDEGDERNAFLVFKPDDTLEDVAERVNTFIDECRTAEKVGQDKTLDILLRFPKFIVRAFVAFLRLLDRYGRMPKELAEEDGMHATVFLANLGSIGIEGAPFHHLYEWGTTSIFAVVGRVHKAQHVNSRGIPSMRDVVDISFSLDERISDGYYFTRSLEMFKRFIENPELLENFGEEPSSSSGDAVSVG